MHIRRAEEMDGRPVEMNGAAGVEMRLMVGREHGAPNFSMRHFTVAPSGHTPRHSHDYEHEIYVVQGKGRVEIDGEQRQIRPGDVVYISPNAIHQFVNVGDSPLKFLCLVPTTFDCCGGDRIPTPGS